MKKGLFLFILLLGSAYAQDVLVDDLPMCGHHDRTTYQALWDSLTAYGASIDFTTDLGRYPTLVDYEMLVIMHHKNPRICDDAGFSEHQREQIIEFVCNGGNLLIFPIIWDDISPHNVLLNDDRWETGIIYGGWGGEIHTTNIADFSPYTDGVEYLYFEISATMTASYPAMPFVWTEDSSTVVAAISYPHSSEYPCSCEAGGRILALCDNHTFEAPVVGYIEPMDHRFIINAMTAMCGISDSLPPCDPVSGVPYADIDTCLNPGEMLTVYGENLHLPMIVRIDGEEVTHFFGADSMSMTFEAPDLPQGTYRVTIEYEGLEYLIGYIELYCDPVHIEATGGGCYEIGDTIYFIGTGFWPDAVIQFVSPDYSDTILSTDFNLNTDSTGWAVVPVVDTSLFAYQYMRIWNTTLGNSDMFFIQIPCPCPGQADMYRTVRAEPRPGDTRNPIVYADPPDSCFVLRTGGGVIEFTTSIDSFMSVPGYWPERFPRNPIDIQVSENFEPFEFMYRNQPNSGSFTYMPSDTASSVRFIISAIDSFGNMGEDTVEACVEPLDDPPLTGILHDDWICEPDSFVFTVRDSSIVDMSTLIIHLDGDRFVWPDSMYWADETTLVFRPPLPWSDSTVHFMRMSEMVMTESGIRLVSDEYHGMGSLFPTDFTPPLIEPISPMPTEPLDSLPWTFRFRISDWLGVLDTSIWVYGGTDTFHIPDPMMLWMDSILLVDRSLLAIDSNRVTICIGAADIDSPIVCREFADTCFTFTLTEPPTAEWLSPDSTVTSCERMGIRFLLSDDIGIDFSTVEMSAGEETGITWGDARLSSSGDTLIFNPDTSWPSCEEVTASLDYILDMKGLTPETLPVTGSFILDLEPPFFEGESPVDRIFERSPVLSVNIYDTCTGIDPTLITLYFDDEPFTLDSTGLVWDEPLLTFDTGLHGIMLDVFDTVTVCVEAGDLAEECGANIDSTCWDIYYYDLICELDIEIEVADTVCYGETVVITADTAGGFGEVIVLWEPPDIFDTPTGLSVIASPESTVLITVTALDDSGCVDIDTGFIYVLPLPVIELSDTMVCLDSTVVLDAGTGYDTYLWNTGDTSQIITVIAEAETTLYFVDVTLDGCPARDSFYVLAEECCALIISARDTFICRGESVMLSFEAGSYDSTITFQWSPEELLDDPFSRTPIATPETSTTFTITAEHSPSCRDTAELRVTVYPDPPLSLEDTIVCFDSLITISVPDTYDTYLWSTGDSTNAISFIEDTSYMEIWLEVSLRGCYARDSFTVLAEDCTPPCTLDIVAYGDTVVCMGDTFYLSAEAPGYEGLVEWRWMPDDAVLFPDSASTPAVAGAVTDFSVIAMFSPDCVDTDYVSIEIHPDPAFLVEDTMVCIGDTITIYAGTVFDSYLWSDSSVNDFLEIVCDFDSALFWVEVSEMGCTARDSFVIATMPCPIFECSLSVMAFSNRDTICVGDTLWLYALTDLGVEPVELEWRPEALVDWPYEDTTMAFPPSDTFFTVTAQDDSGCVDIDTVYVYVIPCEDSCFIHPKPFTPNSDGINDRCKFEYPGMRHDLGTVYLYTLDNVFVRNLVNGDVDETTQDGTILWDGRDERGRLMQNGPYLYIVRVGDQTVCRGVVYIAR